MYPRRVCRVSARLTLIVQVSPDPLSGKPNRDLGFLESFFLKNEATNRNNYHHDQH